MKKVEKTCDSAGKAEYDAEDAYSHEVDMDMDLTLTPTSPHASTPPPSEHGMYSDYIHNTDCNRAKCIVQNLYKKPKIILQKRQSGI